VARLQQQLDVTRKLSLTIVKPLQAEDFVVQPIEDVSPPKWHLGHTTWFFEQFLLQPFLPNYKPFHADFSFLFNSYYESVGKRVLRGTRGNMTRPSTKEVLNYRAYVDEHLQLLFESDVAQDEWMPLIELGIHHEQQHQELLYADIKYILGHNPLFPAYALTSIEDGLSTGPHGTLDISEGLYTIGYQGDGFHFDNEKGVHQVFLSKARVNQGLISNGEYLEFLQQGGYRQFEHWLSEGWTWVQQGNTKPLYWHEVEGEWMEYGLSGLQALNMEAPVKHISFFEADAFAAWRGKRLLSEFEREVLNEKLSNGQLWEWTQNAYLPYPKFDKAPGAIGEYNGKFMINQMVLRGGSIATPTGHYRASYRNFWHTHHQFQFTGIRLAEYC